MAEKKNKKSAKKKTVKKKAEAPPSVLVGQCDTCKKIVPTEDVSKCDYCGKTYCAKCREPYKGTYSNCQFCGAII
jgi:hypothetical protein